MDNKKGDWSAWQRKKVEAGLCTRCGVNKTNGGVSCETCNTHRKQIAKDRGYDLKGRLKKNRVRAIEFLGGVCECCGENNQKFLTFDHLNNDGRADRSDSAKRKMLRDILSEARTDIRILCFNCNCGRQINGGVCPHIDIFVASLKHSPSSNE